MITRSETMYKYRMAPNFRGKKFSYKTLNFTKLNFRDKIFMNWYQFRDN